MVTVQCTFLTVKHCSYKDNRLDKKREVMDKGSVKKSCRGQNPGAVRQKIRDLKKTTI
jgi:hypothetical protein